MKRNLLALIIGLYLSMSISQLSAKNLYPSTGTNFTDSSYWPKGFAEYIGTALSSQDPEKRKLVENGAGRQSHWIEEAWRGHLAKGVKGWITLSIEKSAIGGFYFSSENTKTGTDALKNNTSGADNTADGYRALQSNTSGYENTASGAYALQENTSGFTNTAVGYLALSQNTTGNGNTAIGLSAAQHGGSYQTAIGVESLYQNTGSSNVAIGLSALFANVSGNNNIAIGTYALNGALDQPSESNSVAVGYSALQFSISSTGNNTAVGYNSIYSNTTGYYNVANGSLTMYSNTTGSNNTASGTGALYGNISGSNNVGMGYLTLFNNITGSNNTALGFNAGVSIDGLSNATALGANASVSASNEVVIGSTAVTSIGGYANWSNFSDGRYKKNIQQNVPGLAFINKLKPITYTLDIDGIENKLHESQKTPANKNLGTPASYLQDPSVKQSVQEKSSIAYSGFVAQDVEKAADSIGYEFSGIDKPKDQNQSFYGLRYGDFVVPLVKAVQELSKSSDRKDAKIDSLQLKLDSLQSQINALRAMMLSKNQNSTSAIQGASLDQNVPNPFTNSTTIAYNLPQGVSNAQIQITDVNGKVLQIIPLSGPGKNTLTAGAAGLASGVYTYSLIVNGQLASTKKMVAMK